LVGKGSDGPGEEYEKREETIQPGLAIISWKRYWQRFAYTLSRMPCITRFYLVLSIEMFE